MFVIVIYNILIFVGIGSFLAALLVLADHFLANYGDCELNINNSEKTFIVKGGNSLLNSLAENNIFIPSACGGKGTCGLCKVKIQSDAGPILPTEKPYLDEQEKNDGFRLSCQIRVKRDISIDIPQSLFAIKKYLGRVTRIIDYTYDINGVFIELQEPQKIDFKAGQYLQLESKKYPKVNQTVIRAYSMASSPTDNKQVELIIRLVPDGIMTTFIHKYLAENDRLKFTGPYGDFYIRDSQADMIFVAGGSGMAPFKSILEDLKQKETSRRIVYFFGARTQNDLFLTEEMKLYEKSLPDFTYIPVLSQAEEDTTWKGLRGYIPPLLKDYIRDSQKTEGYLCGSPGMIAATEKKMKELGIERVYYDSFW